jgi:hypothetical protein
MDHRGTCDPAVVSEHNVCLARTNKTIGHAMGYEDVGNTEGVMAMCHNPFGFRFQSVPTLTDVR